MCCARSTALAAEEMRMAVRYIRMAAQGSDEPPLLIYASAHTKRTSSRQLFLSASTLPAVDISVLSSFLAGCYGADVDAVVGTGEDCDGPG